MTHAEPRSRARPGRSGSRGRDRWPGRTVCLLSRIPRRARRGFLRVVATRRLSRCGPVWRATNPALDATAVVLPASALRHTPRGRRNHRPRRGVRRPRPVASGVAYSAARSINIFFHSHFSLFSRESFVRCARKKKKKKKREKKKYSIVSLVGTYQFLRAEVTAASSRM